MSGPRRLLLDTNVVVGALLWSGPPLALMQQAVEEGIELVTSPALMAELHAQGFCLAVATGKARRGLDRVLKKPSDFVRFVGSEVNLRLRVPTSGGRRNFNGVLLACEDGKLRLAIDTGEVELELGNVDKARLVPKFD